MEDDRSGATPTIDTRDLPVRDPYPHLSATAQRILEAALRILERDGFSALTFEAIAAESGENRASIRYHFGSKAGLISVVIDAVMYDGSLDLIGAVAGSEAGQERRRSLIEAHRRVAQKTGEYTAFYDLVPHIVRRPELRERFRQLFLWYRDLDSWALSGSDEPGAGEPYRQLATLTTAMLDGLGLQLLADPDFDIQPAFDLWARMVCDYVERIDAE